MKYKNRLGFFSGVIITLLFHFLIVVIMDNLINLNLNDQNFIIFSGLFDGLAIILSLTAGYYFNQKVILSSSFFTHDQEKQDQKELKIPKDIDKDEDEGAYFKWFLRKFKVDNFKSQLLWTLCLLCLVYLPVDCLSYLVPGVFEYQSNTLLEARIGSYFLFDSFLQMILVALIFHFFIAFREELYFRAFLSDIGKRTMGSSTAFIYSSFLFSLAHFSYIFSPTASQYSVLFPFLWALNSLIIGIASAYYYSEYQRIWPILISHWINNLISSIVTRFFLEGRSFDFAFLRIYLPFFLVGGFLLIFLSKEAKFHFNLFVMKIKGYFIDCFYLWRSESERNLPSVPEVKMKQRSAIIGEKGKKQKKSSRKKKSKVSQWKAEVQKQLNQKREDQKNPPKSVKKDNMQKKKNIKSEQSIFGQKWKITKVNFRKIIPYLVVDGIVVLIIWFFQTFLLLSMRV